MQNRGPQGTILYNKKWRRWNITEKQEEIHQTLRRIGILFQSLSKYEMNILYEEAEVAGMSIYNYFTQKYYNYARAGIIPDDLKKPLPTLDKLIYTPV